MFAAATLLAAILAPASVSRAETVVDNLSAIAEENTTLDTTRLFGQAFTTGANGGTLSSVVLALVADTGSPSVRLSLRPYSTTSFPTDNAVVLNTVAVSTVGGYTFTPQTTVSLLANTSDWLVAQTTTGTALWDYTLSQAIIGTGSLPAAVTAARSTDNGASLSETYSLADGPQQFAVIINPVTVVPESGTAVLLLTALCVGAECFRVMKRHQNRSPKKDIPILLTNGKKREYNRLDFLKSLT
ncbi:MAG: hypothetical protein H7Y38_19730 [Armatimonadetes bacterium]|nr:hypothetical protein [Armatimonadota bacterium]